MMDPSSSSSAAPAATAGGAGETYEGSGGVPFVSAWIAGVSRRSQHVLDKWTPHVLRRWLGVSLLALIYIVRVAIIQGFFVVSYALGIYILNLFIAFLSPQTDPEIQELIDGLEPTLPTRSSDEYRPFLRRLPEFKFWYSITKALCFALTLTFFHILDLPVFWPVLLLYWFVLFVTTMKKQILQMIKYKYVPFSSGKQQYGKRTESNQFEASIPRV